jgi:glucose-1-phosphate thymidylyltransferase
LIISTPHDLPNFKGYWDGCLAIGCKFSYAEQAIPKWFSAAFTLGKNLLVYWCGS